MNVLNGTISIQMVNFVKILKKKYLSSLPQIPQPANPAPFQGSSHTLISYPELSASSWSHLLDWLGSPEEVP